MPTYQTMICVISISPAGWHHQSVRGRHLRCVDWRVPKTRWAAILIDIDIKQVSAPVVLTPPKSSGQSAQVLFQESNSAVQLIWSSIEVQL
jgi:hypothetical protein